MNKKERVEVWIKYAQKLGYCTHCGRDLTSMTCGEIRELFRTVARNPRGGYCGNCDNKLEYYSKDEIRGMFKVIPIPGGCIIAGKK